MEQKNKYIEKDKEVVKRLLYFPKKIFFGGRKIISKKKFRAGKNTNAKYDAFNVMKAVEGDYKLTEKKIFNDSLILLIFGKRGSGKTALGFKIMENIGSQNTRKLCVIGVNDKVLPSWIKSVESIDDVENNSIVLVDEGAISFGSRNSMSSKNKELTKILTIARHKNLTLLFITQNTGLIDKNILALSDGLFIKEGSLLQMEMERNSIKKFYEKANNEFKKLEGDNRGLVYVIDSDFEGVVKYNLPSFWSDGLSKNRA